MRRRASSKLRCIIAKCMSSVNVELQVKEKMIIIMQRHSDIEIQNL
jgi:hypothetical protein